MVVARFLKLEWEFTDKQGEYRMIYVVIDQASVWINVYLIEI